mmetsp:Transcript_79079/g.205503  ORF Transcript_79079/g.205503 Transcript_79079/m.205503 type:complete len:259 (-) Transcript_79079:161-937(-)
MMSSTVCRRRSHRCAVLCMAVLRQLQRQSAWRHTMTAMVFASMLLPLPSLRTPGASRQLVSSARAMLSLRRRALLHELCALSAQFAQRAKHHSLSFQAVPGSHPSTPSVGKENGDFLPMWLMSRRGSVRQFAASSFMEHLRCLWALHQFMNKRATARTCLQWLALHWAMDWKRVQRSIHILARSAFSRILSAPQAIRMGWWRCKAAIFSAMPILDSSAASTFSSSSAEIVELRCAVHMYLRLQRLQTVAYDHAPASLA